MIDNDHNKAETYSDVVQDLLPTRFYISDEKIDTEQ